MNSTKTPWAPTEVAYLIENYPHKDNRTLATELGRTKKQVTLKADRLRDKGIDLRKSAEQKAITQQMIRACRSVRKIGDINSAGSRADRIWNGTGFTDRHRWNYEQAHGPLGRRHYLDCLDGNRRNYDASNWKLRELKPKPQPTPKVKNTPAKLQAMFGSPMAPLAKPTPTPVATPTPRPAPKPAPVIDYAALITFALAYLEAPTGAGFAADQGMPIEAVRNRMEDIRVKFKKHPTGFLVIDGVTHSLREIAARSRRSPGAMPGLNVGGGPGKALLKREESKANQKRRKAWTHTPDGRLMTTPERLAYQVANKVPVQVWDPRMERYDTVYRNRPAA